jgi:hypothetical protein
MKKTARSMSNHCGIKADWLKWIYQQKQYEQEREKEGRKMDYAGVAARIMELCGGNGNVSSVTHCAARLRL